MSIQIEHVTKERIIKLAIDLVELAGTNDWEYICENYDFEVGLFVDLYDGSKHEVSDGEIKAIIPNFYY